MSVVNYLKANLFICHHISSNQILNIFTTVTLFDWGHWSQAASNPLRFLGYQFLPPLRRKQTTDKMLHSISDRPNWPMHADVFHHPPVQLVSRRLIFILVVGFCGQPHYCYWPYCRRRQSVSGTLDRPRVVAPSKTCGHVRSSRRRWRWAQCRPRSAAPTFGRVVLAGASTLAWCPVYRLHECPQPGVVRRGLVLLPVVAARDQKWRVASDKSGLLSLLRQFG